MRGKFDGLTDAQFEYFKPLLPPQRTGRGRHYGCFRKVLNSIIWILITGARWADIPEGEQWSPKSTAHRWLGTWEADGTWERLYAHILGLAQIAGLIDWDRSSVDGSFIPGKGGGEDVEHGYKGKGLTLHAVSDNGGMPLSIASTGAAADERAQVGELLDSINVQTGKSGRPKMRPDALQGDKGYDARYLREEIRRRGISPMIPRRSWPNRKPPVGRPPSKPIDRWKIERTFAWLQKKFRRTAVRWERKNKYWMGFLHLAVCVMWIERLQDSS